MEKIAAKLNIKVNILAVAIAVLVIAACAIPVTYAFFEAGTEMSVTATFGTANTSFDYNFNGMSLRNPGDTAKVSLKVKSSGDIPMRYFFTLERNVEASQLAAYLAVYWDGEYLGMLNDLTTGRLGTFDEGSSIPTFMPQEADVMDDNRYFLTPGDIQEHELAFEYHIGASAIDRATARSAQITIKGYAETIRLEKETVIYNADELEQVVLLSNYGRLTQGRVILGADFAMKKNLTLKGVNTSVGALYLDMNGHIIDAKSYKLTVADGTTDGGILILEDSCGGGRFTGGLALAGSQAFIAGEGINDYTGTIDTAAYNMSSDTFGQLYSNYILPQLKHNTKGGVKSGEANQFLGGYAAYGSALPVTAPNYIGYNASNGNCRPNADVNCNGYININGRSFIFEIIGSLGDPDGEDIESVVDEIETTYLGAITGAGSEGIVYYDILLPTRFKAFGCYAEWYSSNPEVLDANGNYTSPWTDQHVTLQAVYTVNDYTTTRTYDVLVKGYSYEEKMSYYLAHMGVIKFNLLPQDRQLWDKDSYKDVNNCGKDLNIKNISYSIPGSKPGDTEDYTGFLQFVGSDNMALRLYSVSNVFECHIDVTVTFAEPPKLGGTVHDDTNTITRPITVIIDLDDYTTADDILKYVQKYIMKQLAYNTEPEPWDAPVDLYNRMSQQGYGYPTTLELPGYYEATAYAYNDEGELIEYTAGWHQIEYMIPNDVQGSESTGDGDKDYDVAKTGTLEIEYTNTPEIVSSCTLTNTGNQEVSGMTATYTGIATYNLNIDVNKLLTEDQELNLIVSLDTPFEGKYNSVGQWVQATPQDRRNLQFTVPGVIRADTFDSDDADHADAIYGQVRESCVNPVTGRVPNAHPGYIFTRDVSRVSYMELYSCSLRDDNLWALKYFTGLEHLDISGPEGDPYAVGNETIEVISKLPNITYLDMSNCSVTDIDGLASLTNMQELYLSGNNDLNNVTAIIYMAETLENFENEYTACDPYYNEWFYAYCYYKYRDAHNGAEPYYFISNGNSYPGTVYAPPYALWEYPDAYKQYRKLVYTNGFYQDISQVSADTGYLWLPKAMLESINDGAFRSNTYFGDSNWSDSWVAPPGNVSISHASGKYAGNQVTLAGAAPGKQGMIGHKISTTISSAKVSFDEESQSTMTTTENNITVSSTRYFFFNII